MAVVNVTAGQQSSDVAAGKSQNNYARAGGQNVGNFMTVRVRTHPFDMAFFCCFPLAPLAPG